MGHGLEVRRNRSRCILDSSFLGPSRRLSWFLGLGSCLPVNISDHLWRRTTVSGNVD